MSKATIGIILKNGRIGVSIRTEGISQGELAMLITNLELLKQKFLADYKKSGKAFGEGVKNGK